MAIDLPPPQIVALEQLVPQTVEERTIENKETYPDSTNFVKFGTNLIEAGINNGTNSNAVSRAIIDIALNLPNGINFGYSGFNELVNISDGYYGRHVVSVGINNFPISALNVTTVNEQGIMDNMFGLRDSGIIPSLLGQHYGYFDIASNGVVINGTLFVGKEDNNGNSLEITQTAEYRKKSEPFYLTEIQFNKSIDEIYKNVKAFVRTKMENFDPKTAGVDIGVSYTFK